MSSKIASNYIKSKRNQSPSEPSMTNIIHPLFLHHYHEVIKMGSSPKIHSFSAEHQVAFSNLCDLSRHSWIELTDIYLSTNYFAIGVMWPTVINM